MSGGIAGLWPAPVSVRTRTGVLPVSGRVELSLTAETADWADVLLDRLAWLRVRPGTGRPGSSTIRVEHDPGLAEEEFVLDVDPVDGIRITAGSLLGAGHATVTLRQLCPADTHRATPIHRGTWVLPAVRIQDRPALAWRGFMLDVARHFTPKDEVLAIIERMAMHRLNRLHLHLTDDQGWRMESDAYPELARVASWRAESSVGMPLFDGGAAGGDGTPHGGYYTLDDLREITAHARAHGILVVPEVDLPAHAAALLAAVPELRVPGAPVPTVSTASTPSGRVVNPLPAGRAALAIILAELASAVDSPYLHIGGDEADLTDWVASADIQQHLARHGMATVDELRADLTRFLVDQVTALGRRPVVWEEAFLAGGLSPQTIVMAWRAETNGLAAMAAGHDVVMTPMDRTYLDYADTAEDGLALGSGQSVARVAEYTPARGDGPGALLGTQAALWTEFVPDARTRAARMFPRLSIHAANAWTGTATAWPAARPALQAHLERLAAAGVEYRPLDGPHPWQQGGHGRRASVSPLTVDMVAAMLTAFVGDAGTPSAEDLETLLAGIEPAEPVPTP